MAGKVAFELVSPERLLASEDADMVVVPGAEGDFGVLPEHAPVMAVLRPGVIAVYEGDRVTQRYFVAGGFADVNEKGVTVLAEAAEPVAELSGDAARQALKEAQDDLAAAREPSEADRTRLETAITVAEARVEALTPS